MTNKNNKSKLIFIIVNSLFIVTILFSVFLSTSLQKENTNTISYNDFLSMVESEQISDVEINFSNATFLATDINGKKIISDNPKTVNFKEFLLTNNIKINELNSKTTSLITSILSNVIFIIIIALIMHSFLGNSFKGTKMNTPIEIKDISLDSVAGCEESKEEMKSLVNFLKYPDKYIQAGAKLPKGVIFYGPPGTGKTLLAKAIAGEANVPFFSVSGSDFVEKFVGVGASRVRNLFKEAKEKAPCIVFIDEIDAIGTTRGSDNNSEKDTTINALLTELDGIDTKKGVLVITATNRVDKLDSALTRPGRFDKKISIPLPDKKDRLKMLKLYLTNKCISEDIDYNQLVNMTFGFSGADIEALVNESMILAIDSNRNTLTMEDLSEAHYKLVMNGHKKKNGYDNYETKKLVAYHEAGHALVTKLLTSNEVPSISIIPSTSGAGGVTFVIPSKESFISKNDIYNQIKIKYAGRAAERILFDNEEDITIGASNDIDGATTLIKNAISLYGMDKTIGLLNLDILTKEKQDILEQSKILAKQLYDDTVKLLSKNSELLSEIANNLIEFENINEIQLDTIIAKYI